MFDFSALDLSNPVYLTMALVLMLLVIAHVVSYCLVKRNKIKGTNGILFLL